MDFCKPVFAKDKESLDKFQKENEKVIIGSYCPSTSLSTHEFKTFITALLFDFPKGMIMMLDDHFIPCNIFDYMNPLMFCPIIADKCKFYMNDKRIPLNDITCMILYLSLKNDQELTSIKLVKYPKKYRINYHNGKVARNDKGAYMYDLIHKILRKSQYQDVFTTAVSGLQIPSVSIPIPSNSSNVHSGFHNFMNNLMNNLQNSESNQQQLPTNALQMIQNLGYQIMQHNHD